MVCDSGEMKKNPRSVPSLREVNVVKNFSVIFYRVLAFIYWAISLT